MRNKREIPILKLGEVTFNKDVVASRTLKQFKDDHEHLINPPKELGRKPLNLQDRSLESIWKECGGKEKEEAKKK